MQEQKAYLDPVLSIATTTESVAGISRQNLALSDVLVTEGARTDAFDQPLKPL